LFHYNERRQNRNAFPKELQKIDEDNLHSYSKAFRENLTIRHDGEHDAALCDGEKSAEKE